LSHKWICGDALAEMDGLSDIDLVIADPPYGTFPLINFAIDMSRELCAGPSFFFMYGEDLVDLKYRPDQVLFWTKTVSTKNTKRRYSRFVEVIAAYDLDKSPFLQDTHWSTRSGVFTDQLTYRVHEFQKPVSLMEKLLAVNSREGDLVLDPFAGSGSVRKACEIMGRNSISIEIDKRLCQN
jgi:DNA modification methylase